MVSGDEPEVTTLMEARLNSLIDENVLWGQLVLSVARGKESISFDGSHLEMRPDLLIYLSDRTRRFPLVVEAKILDVDNGKTVASYCNNGVHRFVVGEYAWASREAFILGYVRDGSSIDTTLRPRLAEAMALSPPTYLVEALPVQVSSAGQDLAYTRHGRDFAYGCQTPPNSPGPIAIWHLWLSLWPNDAGGSADERHRNREDDFFAVDCATGSPLIHQKSGTAIPCAWCGLGSPCRTRVSERLCSARSGRLDQTSQGRLATPVTSRHSDPIFPLSGHDPAGSHPTAGKADRAVP